MIYLLDEMAHLRPGKWTERLTPWIFLVIGGSMVLLMVYSCTTANQ